MIRSYRKCLVLMMISSAVQITMNVFWILKPTPVLSVAEDVSWYLHEALMYFTVCYVIIAMLKREKHVSRTHKHAN